MSRDTLAEIADQSAANIAAAQGKKAELRQTKTLAGLPAHVIGHDFFVHLRRHPLLVGL